MWASPNNDLVVLGRVLVTSLHVNCQLLIVNCQCGFCESWVFFLTTENANMLSIVNCQLSIVNDDCVRLVSFLTTEFHRVRHRVSQSITEYHRVSQSITEYHRVYRQAYFLAQKCMYAFFKPSIHQALKVRHIRARR
jgi:hypothetical protein